MILLSFTNPSRFSTLHSLSICPITYSCLLSYLTSCPVFVRVEYCPCLIKDCGHEQPDPNAVRQLCQPVAVINAVAASSSTSISNKRPVPGVGTERTEPTLIGVMRKYDKASILARNQRKQQLREEKERKG